MKVNKREGIWRGGQSNWGGYVQLYEMDINKIDLLTGCHLRVLINKSYVFINSKESGVNLLITLKSTWYMMWKALTPHMVVLFFGPTFYLFFYINIFLVLGYQGS